MSTPVRKSHPSDSEPQKRAEVELRLRLQTELGCNLEPETIHGPAGECLKVDCCSKSVRILCEIYAHVGSLKGSQPNKPLADAVKMKLAEQWLGGYWRKVFVFADEMAASGFQNNSWRAEAMKQLGIEIRVVSLENRSSKSVAKAQLRQNMGNIPK